MTIFQDIISPYRHRSWASPFIRLPSHPDTKTVSSLISLFHVPQKQQKFYIAFSWSVTVAGHHSDSSDFCLKICVQLPEYTLMASSCYFQLLNCFMLFSSVCMCKQLKLVLWCMVGDCQAIVETWSCHDDAHCFDPRISDRSFSRTGDHLGHFPFYSISREDQTCLSASWQGSSWLISCWFVPLSWQRFESMPLQDTQVWDIRTYSSVPVPLCGAGTLVSSGVCLTRAIAT